MPYILSDQQCKVCGKSNTLFRNMIPKHENVTRKKTMPFTLPNGKRDYKRENALYNSKPEQIKNRSKRNKARALVAKAKGKAAIAGKDIAHGKALSKGGSNTLANLFIESASSNRSFSRDSNSKLKSERSKREKR